MSENSSSPIGSAMKIVFKKKTRTRSSGEIKTKWVVSSGFGKQRKSNKMKKNNVEPAITITLPVKELKPKPPAIIGKRKRKPSTDEEPAPKRVKTSKVKTKTTPPVRAKPKKPMALYKVISTMIKQLIQQDKQSIFYESVSDDVAPGYSSVIEYPMCFLTMRSKLTKRLYTTFAAAQMDFKLIFENAMTYNPVDTIYYEDAKRMMEEAKKLAANYKLKLVEDDLGDSDPLFEEGKKAIPLVFEAEEPKAEPAPIPKPEPIIEKKNEKETHKSPVKQRNRPLHYRKRKKDSPSPSPALSLQPAGIPVTSMPIAPFLVQPAHVFRCFVRVSDSVLPNSPNVMKEPTYKTINMFSECAEGVSLGRTLGDNIVTNTYDERPKTSHDGQKLPDVQKKPSYTDICISKLSNMDRTRVAGFLVQLSEGKKLEPFVKVPKPITTKPSQNLRLLDHVEPATEMKATEREYLASLGIGGVDPKEESEMVEDLLCDNSELISQLSGKQKKRLVHHPSLEEKKIARKLVRQLCEISSLVSSSPSCESLKVSS